MTIKMMDENLKKRILKEARKRYTNMIVTHIFESPTHYEVEYLRGVLGGKVYVARIHKELVEE